MEFDTLILLLAAGYALLQWMLRGIRKAGGEADEPAPDTTMDQAEVEVRRRHRLEELRQRRLDRIEARRQRAGVSREPKRPQDRQVEEFQRTLERLLGVRTGPSGRRGSVDLDPAEEVEEIGSHDRDEPVVVSLESAAERPARVVYDQDSDAETLVQRRIAAAQARSGALTKADHARFDQKIRAASEPLQVHRKKKARLPRAGSSIRDAVVWSEILGPPVARR